jgi:hypothetical protein
MTTMTNDEKAKWQQIQAFCSQYTISEHSQDKIRELHIFCKFSLLLCFEMLVFEKANSEFVYFQAQ